MKLFEDLKTPERKEPEKIQVDSAVFMKKNLMKSVDRNTEVYQAVEKWVMSFEGGITKAMFQAQMKRLDWDDKVALAQLERAKGRRTIPLPPPPKKPPLDAPLVEKMLEEKYVAIYGRKFKPLIKNTVTELKSCGKVYVLPVEELIVEFSSFEQKGKSPQMIKEAIECDFLFIVNLEMPIHLEWHIHEALNRILRLRLEAGKPIISTWNRYNDCNDFFEKFHIYVVE